MQLVRTPLMGLHVLVMRDTLEMGLSAQVCSLHNFTNKSLMLKFFFPDIDECQFDVCDKNANCSDVDGSFECTCNTGFSGDGITCFGMLPLADLHFNLHVVPCKVHVIKIL